jgi:hypothetical protein
MASVLIGNICVIQREPFNDSSTGSHVGFFIGGDPRDGYVALLGGNQNNSVCRKWFVGIEPTPRSEPPRAEPTARQRGASVAAPPPDRCRARARPEWPPRPGGEVATNRANPKGLRVSRDRHLERPKVRPARTVAARRGFRAAPSALAPSLPVAVRGSRHRRAVNLIRRSASRS